MGPVPGAAGRERGWATARRFVRGFPGYDHTDSTALLKLFQRHVTRPENTMRWRWSPDDVAIWDNRATQHHAVTDYGRLPRKPRRITVAGEALVSVQGGAQRRGRGEFRRLHGTGHLTLPGGTRGVPIPPDRVLGVADDRGRRRPPG